MYVGRQANSCFVVFDGHVPVARRVVQLAQTLLAARVQPWCSVSPLQFCVTTRRSQKVCASKQTRAPGLPACRFNLLPGSQDVRNDGVRSGERPRDIVRGEGIVRLVCSTADGSFCTSRTNVEAGRPSFCRISGSVYSCHGLHRAVPRVQTSSSAPQGTNNPPFSFCFSDVPADRFFRRHHACAT